MLVQASVCCFRPPVATAFALDGSSCLPCVIAAAAPLCHSPRNTCRISDHVSLIPPPRPRSFNATSIYPIPLLFLLFLVLALCHRRCGPALSRPSPSLIQDHDVSPYPAPYLIPPHSCHRAPHSENEGGSVLWNSTLLFHSPASASTMPSWR